MNPLVWLFIGLALGTIIGWFIGHYQKSPLVADSRMENELRERLKQRDDEIAASQQELLGQKEQTGRLSAEIQFLNERLATERQQIESIQERFQKAFEAASNKLLADNSNRFSKQSADSLGLLLRPLKDELQDFKNKLDATRKETATHSALLKNEIGHIGTEAANLSRALKGDVKVLGNWGENMLDQILEISGLQLGLHYRRQRAAMDDEGEQRFLDVVVELPDKPPAETPGSSFPT